jgi:hypothetical protein
MWVAGSSLAAGGSKSCGCLNREVAAKKARREGRDSKHALATVWGGMMQRCYNPKASKYKYWGEKGIKVCQRWHNIHFFAEDIPPRPSPDHQLHRIDGNRDYEPGTVVWMTRKEHAMLHGNGQWFVVDGIRDSMKATAKRIGVGRETFRLWLDRGFTGDEIAGQFRSLPHGCGHHSLFRFLHIPENAPPERFHELVKAMLDALVVEPLAA